MIEKFKVREAKPDEHDEILALNARAFGHEDEARIVVALEKAGDVLLQIVAVMDEQVVGHLLFYGLGVLGRLSACGLGPMCVDPWVQREGVGKAMVTAGVNYLREVGVPIVFVLGHVDYYPKFGFSAAATEPFETPIKGPAFMALRLRGGPPMSGKLIFPEAFGIARSP